MPLLRLLPNQCIEHWKTLRHCIASALPPMVAYRPGVMARILRALATGMLQAWIIYKRLDDKSAKVVAVATTQISNDLCTGTRNFIIFSLYGTGGIDSEIWSEMMKSAEEFAKANDCDKIVAYTSEKSIIRALERAGWTTEYVFVTKEIEL